MRQRGRERREEERGDKVVREWESETVKKRVREGVSKSSSVCVYMCVCVSA